MSAKASREDDRQVIPRWRSFRRTVVAGELGALHRPEPEDISSEIATLRQSVTDAPGPFTRADLLNALISANIDDDETRSLADELALDPGTPEPLRGFSMWAAFRHRSPQDETLEGSTSQARKTEISTLRYRLKERPRNAVLWVDLSLAFATLGNSKKSIRAMETALGLSLDSRFVLRAAARLFVHLEDPERANRVLARSARLKYDPWLLSAELSTAQLAYGRFQHARAARELLTSAQFSPFALSELASELASGEIMSGRDRRARNLFAQSLISPTENAVAQAASMSEKGDLRFDPKLLDVKGGYEARAISHSRAGSWHEATAEAVNWHRDQPFAIEPITFGSYTASLGEADYVTGLALARDGLQTHPKDALLNNNAAFALAHMGKPEEAQAHLRIAVQHESIAETHVYEATQGLIDFRRGLVAAGRKSYESAIEGLKKEGQTDMVAVATSLWAIEEVRQSTPQALEAVKRAASASKLSTTAETRTLRSRLAAAANVHRG
ncbi:hypothetical protein IFT79_04665 [Frigoribacterium sp. CFBP 8759]|uniref:tetratricopeptide repeat protein n=1 Tax=Frigoribacterium sp. CFBP 8759 TaxID=2775283 RepID=UPI001782272A|nr:hypothetical protein [Frigoribacterium sp. CFBP 8759]MBD8484902.1 hypothetical protein [Frigoribacterium sp. CFBP 8759]